MEESYFTSLPEWPQLDKRFLGNGTKRKDHSAPPQYGGLYLNESVTIQPVRKENQLTKRSHTFEKHWG
jgi:hypothetical protein